MLCVVFFSPHKNAFIVVSKYINHIHLIRKKNHSEKDNESKIRFKSHFTIVNNYSYTLINAMRTDYLPFSYLCMFVIYMHIFVCTHYFGYAVCIF